MSLTLTCFIFKHILKRENAERIYRFEASRWLLYLFPSQVTSTWEWGQRQLPGQTMTLFIPKYASASCDKDLILKVSFSFPEIILKIMQTHSMYTTLSFYINFIIFCNTG